MVKVTVSVNTGGLMDKLNPEQVNQVKRKGLNYASQEMIRVLMINSPVDHGLLKSWFLESINDNDAHIKTPAEYAYWVDQGHSQQPGRFIPGEWHGDKFEYIPNHKKGMVLKASHVKGKKFVKKSIDEVEGRLDGYFLKALSEVLG